MKYSGSLVKKEREDIFKLFIDSEKLKFSEIEKRIGIRSNMVSYHLGEMVKEGLLEKQGDHYQLTAKAETYIPLFELVTGQEISPVAVVLAAVLHEGKILLIKRQKRPYKGYWALPGGKILLGESIPEASARIVEGKARVKANFSSSNAIMYENVVQDDIIKHGFIHIFTNMIALSAELPKSVEAAWFDLDRPIDGKIIPSDKWLIENHLSSEVIIHDVKMKDDGGELSDFRADGED